MKTTIRYHVCIECSQFKQCYVIETSTTKTYWCKDCYERAEREMLKSMVDGSIFP